MSDKARNDDRTARYWLSIGVPVGCSLGIVALAWVVLSKSEIDDETIKYVFASILPLLGTWVGTVLAYHFSKDNFESASKSVETMVEKLTASEKLEKTVVSDVMIDIRKAHVLALKEGEEFENLRLIKRVLARLEETEYKRLPILDSGRRAKLLLHRSTIDQFIARSAREGMTKADLEKLDIAALLDDEIANGLRERSFVTVAASENLAKAKSKMESIEDYSCLDALVTTDGTKNTPVVGWIPNVIVLRVANV